MGENRICELMTNQRLNAEDKECDKLDDHVGHYSLVNSFLQVCDGISKFSFASMASENGAANSSTNSTQTSDHLVQSFYIFFKSIEVEGQPFIVGSAS